MAYAHPVLRDVERYDSIRAALRHLPCAACNASGSHLVFIEQANGLDAYCADCSTLEAGAYVLHVFGAEPVRAAIERLCEPVQYVAEDAVADSLHPSTPAGVR